MDSGGNSKKSTPMDAAAKSRIMSSYAKKPGSGGQIKSGTFPARAQAAADRNAYRAQSDSAAASDEGWCTLL